MGSWGGTGRLSVVSSAILQSLSTGNLGSSQSEVNLLSLRRSVRDFRERSMESPQTDKYSL